MILLGGDLFDKNQPPKHVRHRLMSLLHEYVIGDRFIDFEIVCGTGSVLSKGWVKIKTMGWFCLIILGKVN